MVENGLPPKLTPILQIIDKCSIARSQLRERERKSARTGPRSAHHLGSITLIENMRQCGIRSVSFPLFRYTHRNYLPTQRIRPFTMGSAEVQRVNTTQRLRVLRELMAQEKRDVNALIVPSEDQRALRYKLVILGHHL